MKGSSHRSDYRIGIITTPISKAGIVPVSDLITIIRSISKNVFLITGGEGYDFFRENKEIKTLGLSPKNSSFFMKRIFNYLSLQLEISLYIFKTRKEIDFFIFFINADVLLLPALTAHLFKKKVIVMFAASTVKIHASNKDPLVSGLKILHFFTCMAADKIIVYADRIIRDYSLERWIRKIVIAHQHFINFKNFNIKKEYRSREYLIGYVGRFSEEKGILHLLDAVSDIHIKKPDIKFLIIGDGPLRNKIEQFILDNNLSDMIIFPGWISHDELPDYLNQMRLLVIPSDTEGLPSVMLEAMACGTPVLATPVGGISSFIRDGETGFILENNSPQCITSTIIKIFDDKRSVDIIRNAQQLVQNDFKFEKLVEEFKTIFDNTVV
jgi:glycosyltransferase involved in cell wall biosynthesis